MKRFKLGGPSKLHSTQSLEGTSLCVLKKSTPSYLL